MKLHSFYLLFIIVVLIPNNYLFAQSANKLRKIGNEFEKSKAFEKASDYYLQALTKRSNDKNSINSLRRSAPKVLDEYTKHADQAFKRRKYDVVIEKYELSKEFKSKIKRYDVNVNIPKSLIDLKNSSDEYFAEIHYDKGKHNFDNGLHDAAIKELQKCLTFKNYYKDARTILNQAKDAKKLLEAERHYFNGVAKLNKNDFRGAYWDFEKCLSNKSPYKDAYELKADALKNGLAKVGVFNVQNSSNYRNGIEKTLYSKMINNIEKKRSPFIKIVSSNSIKQMYGNSRVTLNESTAARIGRDIGLEFILVAKIIEVERSGGTPQAKEITAYEKYYVKNSEGKKVPKGRKVKFKLYEGSSDVTFRVRYQLISTKNNQVVQSDVITESASDNVKYASYRGDYKKLCVTDPGSNGGGILGSLLTNVTMVDQKLFTARKKLKSPYDLHQPAFESLARKIANGVYNEIQ